MGKKPCFGRWRRICEQACPPTSVPPTAHGIQPTGSNLGFQWNPCAELKFIWKERCATLQFIIKDYFAKPAALPDLIWYSHVHWLHVSVCDRKSFLFSLYVCVCYSLLSLFFCFLFQTKTFRYSSVNDIFEERAVKLGWVPFVRQPQCINGPHPSSWPMTLLTVLFLRNLPTLQLPPAC